MAFFDKNQISTSMTGEPWSGDSYFLFNIEALIQKYVDSDFANDIEGEFKAVKNIKLIITPKIEEEEINKKFEGDLTWIKNAITQAYVVQDGRVMGVHPGNYDIVRNKLDDLLKEMLCYLEKHGIYTKKFRDPGMAAGRFSGS